MAGRLGIFPKGSWVSDYISASRMARDSRPDTQPWMVGWMKIGALIEVGRFAVEAYDKAQAAKGYPVGNGKGSTGRTGNHTGGQK